MACAEDDKHCATLAGGTWRGNMGPAPADVMSALQNFFGGPANPSKVPDYSSQHAATYAFPDAYIGQSTKLRDTMVNLIMQSPQTWHTSMMLPFTKVEGTVVEWDEMHFDVRLMNRVPYEGVSRMQTSNKRRHRDRIIRRGLAMMIESDFYSTPAGQKHFQQQLLSIRYCVQETCNFDVLYALLTCQNYDFRYDITRGLRPARSLKTATAHEVLMFAGVQKTGYGFDRLVEEAKVRMARYNVEPNMLIVPPQLSYYMSMVPEEKINYSITGTEGPKNFKGGVAGFEGRSFRGLEVVRAMPFETQDETDSSQLLRRAVQTGEYYIVGSPDYEAEAKSEADRLSQYSTIIYDEETDSMKRIDTIACVDWLRLLVETHYKKKRIPAQSQVVDDVTLGLMHIDGSGHQSHHMDAFLMEVFDDQEKVDVMLAAGGCFHENLRYASVTTVGHLKAAIKDHTTGPFVQIKFAVVRPFIEHNTLSAVVSVAGSDTGATLFGPSDMQLSSNTSTKVVEGHYTMHSKAVVTQPKNVFVMKDVLLDGYVAGGGTNMFAADEFSKQINDRLCYDSCCMDMCQIPAMFPIPVPQGWCCRDVVSVSDRALPWIAAGNQCQAPHFPGLSCMYTIYAKLMGGSGLSSIHDGEDTGAVQNQDFLPQDESTNNSLCFLGPHRRFNAATGSGFALVAGQGHFGADALPGDARWRRGEATTMDATRSEMYSGNSYTQLNINAAMFGCTPHS